MVAADSPIGRPPDWDGLLGQQLRANGRLFFKLAHDIVREVSEAEDACQAAFAKAWERRAEIRDAAALKGWLVRAVTNEALQLARRHKIEQRALQGHVPPSAASRPELERLAAREALQKALAFLPEQTQVVIVLRVIEGMSGNEVARVLGCCASEVSRRLYEGLERLREVLTEVPVVVEGK